MLSLCKLYSNKKGGEGYEVAWIQPKTQSNYFASFLSDKKKIKTTQRLLQVYSDTNGTFATTDYGHPMKA